MRRKRSTASTDTSTHEDEMVELRILPFHIQLYNFQRTFTCVIPFEFPSTAMKERREQQVLAFLLHKMETPSPKTESDLKSRVRQFLLPLQHSSFLLHGGLDYRRNKGEDRGKRVKDRGLAEETGWRKKTT